MLHPMLQRQLKQLGLLASASPDAKDWAQFLERVDRSYRDYDQDRYLVERSLGVSSEEMRELTGQLQSALEQVRNLSLTDELTGLRNRRFLNIAMPIEEALVIRKYNTQKNDQSLRTDSDMLFLMVDMDLFKNVNDTYGHQAGDMVIQQTGKILVNCSRSTDFVSRWGGDEFLIVERQSCSAELKALAERIRRTMDAHPFEVGRDEPIHVTCSIGAAVFPFLPAWPHLLGWERLVGLADLCLYAAKHSGRNTWVGILPTDRISMEELASPFDEHIPQLIREDKLELISNLPPGQILIG